jgi:hypothetical protein
MTEDFDIRDNEQQIKIAVIIAIVLGLVTSVFFLLIENNSYSAVYLVPGSILYDPGNNTVFYVYGVLSSESEKMDYTLDTYIDDDLAISKSFSLNKGETLEERVETPLPPGEYDQKKITLTLTTGSASESVHFWVNKSMA